MMQRNFRSSEGLGTEEDWRHVTQILNDIADECRNYVSSLALKKFIADNENQRDKTNWHYTAHESSIFAINNFISILSLLACDKLIKSFELGRISVNNALQKTKENFPDARNLRDAIAHPEVYSRRAAKVFARQVVQLDDLPVSLGPGVLRRIAINDYYICSFEGRILKQQLSDRNADRILEIMDELVEPFLLPIESSQQS